MKKIYIIVVSLLALALTSIGVYGQKYELPYVSIKTNVIYDATTTINLGAEVGLGKQTTIDIGASYNPWVFNDGRKFKLWLIQPEFRYYLKNRFEGHFVGAHLHYGQYNVYGIGLFSTSNSIKQGDLYGAGLTYGYAWRFNSHWGIEAQIGLGFARLKYDLYDCAQCGRKVDTQYKTYLGPTKIAVTLIYRIR